MSVPNRSILACVALLATVPAQSTDPVAAPAADLLAGYARACERAGAVERARRAWLELLIVYEPASPAARAALLASREPGPAAGRGAEPSGPRLERRLDALWNDVAERLADLHRKAARRAEDGADAAPHWERVLRFEPGDEEAGRALGREPFEGAWLTADQCATLVRDRARAQVLEVLAATTWPVEAVDDGPVPELVSAGPAGFLPGLAGCRGPHAEVWGDGDPRRLRDAVLGAERTALLVRALLADARHLGELRRDGHPVFVGVGRRADYRSLVDLSDQEADERAFARDQMLGTWLRRAPRRIYAAHAEGPTLTDWVVRLTAVRIGDPEPFALAEGLGHAVCHWLLGQSVNHFAGPPPAAERRTASEELTVDVLLPEVAVWRRLAIEQAWLGSGPGLARLCGHDASDMPNPARIEAWAVTRYLLARDPVLWRQLGAAATAGLRDPATLRATFERDTGVTTDDLHARIRAHWRTDEESLAAWRDQPSRAPAAERAVAQALRRIAGSRAAASRPPFGAVAGLPADVDPGALVDVPVGLLGADGADGAFAIPALRDLALAAEVGTVRFAAPRGRAVLWVPPLPVSATPAQAIAYPADGAADVPTEVPVERLGSDVVDLLGRPPATARVGYPLSLHTASLDADALAGVRCDVDAGGVEVPGALVVPAAGVPARLAPAGVAVFYPAAALPAGAAVRVTWRWRDADGRRQELEVRFETR